MLQFNKKVSSLFLLSVILCFGYSAQANVKYIDMKNPASHEASQDYIQIIAPPTVRTTNSITRSRTKLDTIIDHNARKYNIPAELLRAIIRQESNFDNAAVSPKGARGLMQVMPSTASDYGIYDLHMPHHNVEVGSRHLSSLLKKYNLPTALAAYNAGEGNVNKYGGIPPFRETQNYVLNVLKYYNVELDNRIDNSDKLNATTNLVSDVNSSVVANKFSKITKKNPVLYITIDR